MGSVTAQVVCNDDGSVKKYILSKDGAVIAHLTPESAGALAAQLTAGCSAPVLPGLPEREA